MNKTNTAIGRGAALILVGCCLTWTAVLAAGEDCRGEIAVDLQSRDETADQVRLHFAVELSAPDSCEAATYDLILVEMLPNKQWKSVRLTRRVELDQGQATESVEHVMAGDLKLLEYEARIVSCSSCASDG